LYPTTEKTSSVVSHNGGKLLPLWDTTKENLRRCWIQCGRFFWDTVHCIRFCCGVGYNGKKISCVVGYNRNIFFAILRLFSVVSHNGKNPLLLYPTTEENPSPLYPTAEKLYGYNPQRKKTSSVVSHNNQKTLNLNGFTKKKFFSKMILTHESGSQEDQFDEKKWRQKIS
jgi:hypothetical protein